MIKRNKEEILFKCAAAAALAALAASLIPLLMLAPYSAPVADDFGYGAPVYYALQAGLGLPGALGAIVENVVYTYQNWQGTFSSVLLFSIQPGVLSDGFYAITPVVMLATIIAPVFWALGTLRSADKFGRRIIAAVIAFLSVQYLPSAAEGLYWWNGAAHYLVFWCLAVGVLVGQVRLSRSEGRGAGFYAQGIACVIGAFLVGGGNYSTALVLALAAGTLTVYLLAMKYPRHVIVANALVALFSLLGLAVSMIAPGNAVRQSGFAGMSAVSAIALSFRQAALEIVRMTDAKLIGALLLCVAVFLFSVRKSEYRFRLPFLVLPASFCGFAALFTPPIFAMGQSDVPRMNNLFWLAYLFLAFGNAFYLAGWVALRVRIRGVKHARPLLTAVCAVGVILFGGATFIQAKTSNVYLAYSDLRSGVLETYRRERADRVAIYHDKSIPEPRFTVMSNYPNCFPKVTVLTWMSDLLVDNVPTQLSCYHSCGGEVTFIPFDEAIRLFRPEKDFTLADFSKTFSIVGVDCVPLREFCNQLGFEVSHDFQHDTVRISTR